MITPLGMNGARPELLTVIVDPFGIWHTTLFFGLLLALIFWVRVQKWELLWVYALAQALYLVEYPALSFGRDHIAYQATAGQALVEAMLIPYLALACPNLIKKILPVFVVIEMLSVWVFHRGIMGQESFDTALLALCVPALPSWFVLPIALTALTRHGSTAVVILLVETLLLLPRRWRNIFVFLDTALVAALGLTIYIRHLGLGDFDLGNRLTVWKLMMSTWATSWENIFLGVGAGSFTGQSMTIGKFQSPIFLQMHNDWLQIMRDLGLIGFGLASEMVGRAVRLSKERPTVLAGVVGSCVFALAYHPLRFFPSALMVAFYFAEALSSKPDSLQTRLT